MVLTQKRRAIATFPNRIDAEHALSELDNAGFPMAQISVIAKDADRDAQFGRASMSDIIGDKTQERNATFATITGSMVGAIGGCLVGFGVLAVPGVGSLIPIGTSGTALVTTIAGAGIGVASCGLIEALADLGIASDQSKYRVIVDGTDDEVGRAKTILKKGS